MCAKETLAGAHRKINMHKHSVNFLGIKTGCISLHCMDIFLIFQSTNFACLHYWNCWTWRNCESSVLHWRLWFLLCKYKESICLPVETFPSKENRVTSTEWHHIALQGVWSSGINFVTHLPPCHSFPSLLPALFSFSSYTLPFFAFLFFFFWSVRDWPKDLGHATWAPVLCHSVLLPA